MRVLVVLSVLLLGSCALVKSFAEPEVTPEVLPEAEQFVGMHERANRKELKEFMGIDPAAIEWCAAFVNSVLDRAGISSTESLLARSYLKWGLSTEMPQPGDIMVFRRGTEGWQGHVGFYVETVTVDDVEYFVVLGGNQDQSVSYRLYPVTTPKLLDIRTVSLPTQDDEMTVTLSAKNWRQPDVPLMFEND
jgi:uncharacterized protein (TIGR02594 family)